MIPSRIISRFPMLCPAAPSKLFGKFRLMLTLMFEGSGEADRRTGGFAMKKVGYWRYIYRVPVRNTTAEAENGRIISRHDISPVQHHQTTKGRQEGGLKTLYRSPQHKQRRHSMTSGSESDYLGSSSNLL